MLKPLEMLLSIAHEDRQKYITSLSSSSSSDRHQQAMSSHLEHLICSLQSQLLAWSQQHLAGGTEDGGRHRGDHRGDHSTQDDESRLIVQAVIVGCMYCNNRQARTQEGLGVGYEDPPIAKNIPKRCTLSA